MLAAVLGAVFGSFLNVVAYRLPRGESLSRPRSRCPGCLTQIRAYDNVPVLSWLALRGRCRTCREPISARYPLVEAATGALCALVVLAKGPDEDALLGLALVLLLVPVTLIDLDHRIIPNRLMLIGADPRTTARAPQRARRARRAPCSPPWPRAASSSSPCSPTRAGWGWATSSSRSSSGCSWAVTSARRCSWRSSRARSSELPSSHARAPPRAARPRSRSAPSSPSARVVALFAGDAMVEWYLSTFA